MKYDFNKVKNMFISIINNVSEYDEFNTNIKCMDNENKGHLFELFCKLYFTS